MPSRVIQAASSNAPRAARFSARATGPFPWSYINGSPGSFVRAHHAILRHSGGIDVRSGHETARMLKTASPMLSRKSDNDFHGALRAFRTMLGFELAKLGF